MWKFYGSHKRDFPWRNTSDFYNIWVSEMMLQQTQTSRVIDKYNEFIRTFPDFQSLANAPQSEVLRLWQGLGYNRRALYLKRSAEIITVANKENQKIVTTEFLVTLPGIGPNTAGAIYAFTMNKPVVFIETNIRRVMINEFFKNQSTVDDKEILQLIEQTLDSNNPREWYYALMDYGAYLAKTISNPNRQSRHYTKQSKFEGSLRQTRGKILKLLLNGPQKFTQFSENFKEDHNFHDAINQLTTENFIEQDDKSIKLRS